jgi:hypothetical protein
MRSIPQPTLLDLVTAVSELSASHEEAAEVVVHLLRSGRVRIGDGTSLVALAAICRK